MLEAMPSASSLIISAPWVKNAYRWMSWGVRPGRSFVSMLRPVIASARYSASPADSRPTWVQRSAL
ncbi:MAG: hypothetical protein A2177_08115 [Spirochaetes bacterium RBG_13_68_11]|nr:MAG: hypothetical protein A2177_08115 [Spirochaetes bacterium RBG_13_68_11]